MKGLLYYHVYQRSKDKREVFKKTNDALVFISILSIKAKKFGVSIPALCLMDNHIHILVGVPEEDTLNSFVSETISLFTRRYNKEHIREGSLFKRPFGSALKNSDKYVRNCISYIYNNPVEAKKCRKIEDYVWNLIAYYNNSYPFSKPFVVRRALHKLKQSYYELKDIVKENKPLNYTLLRHLFEGLPKEESKQLRDMLISFYNPIEYDNLIYYFGSYEKALLAINSFNGSEYQLKEDDRI